MVSKYDYMGPFKTGVFLGGSHNENYGILGCTLGGSDLWKLSYGDVGMQGLLIRIAKELLSSKRLGSDGDF